MTQARAWSRRPARCPSPWQDAAGAIDADLVRRLIASQFPRYRELPVVASSPAGMTNRTFRVGNRCARPAKREPLRSPPADRACVVATAGRPPAPAEPQPVALGAPGAGYHGIGR